MSMMTHKNAWKDLRMNIVMRNLTQKTQRIKLLVRR